MTNTSPKTESFTVALPADSNEGGTPADASVAAVVHRLWAEYGGEIRAAAGRLSRGAPRAVARALQVTDPVASLGVLKFSVGIESILYANLDALLSFAADAAVLEFGLVGSGSGVLGCLEYVMFRRKTHGAKGWGLIEGRFPLSDLRRDAPTSNFTVVPTSSDGGCQFEGQVRAGTRGRMLGFVLCDLGAPSQPTGSDTGGEHNDDALDEGGTTGPVDRTDRGAVSHATAAAAAARLASLLDRLRQSVVVLKESGSLLLRMYRSDLFGEGPESTAVIRVVWLMGHLFETVAILKPVTSPPSTLECFVYFNGRTGRPFDPATLFPDTQSLLAWAALARTSNDQASGHPSPPGPASSPSLGQFAAQVHRALDTQFQAHLASLLSIDRFLDKPYGLGPEIGRLRAQCWKEWKLDSPLASDDAAAVAPVGSAALPRGPGGTPASTLPAPVPTAGPLPGDSGAPLLSGNAAAASAAMRKVLSRPDKQQARFHFGAVVAPKTKQQQREEARSKHKNTVYNSSWQGGSTKLAAAVAPPASNSRATSGPRSQAAVAAAASHTPGLATGERPRPGAAVAGTKRGRSATQSLVEAMKRKKLLQQTAGGGPAAPGSANTSSRGSGGGGRSSSDKRPSNAAVAKAVRAPGPDLSKVDLSKFKSKAGAAKKKKT